MYFFYKIKKAIHKKSLLGMIAKNAMTQSIKWRQSDPTLTEAEIAHNIFVFRYANGIFSDEQKREILRYTNYGFKCESLVDFCLASLDIEGGIRPIDGAVYNRSALLLEEILIDYGYQSGEPSIKHSLRTQDLSSKINAFNMQWGEMQSGIRLNKR